MNIRKTVLKFLFSKRFFVPNIPCSFALLTHKQPAYSWPCEKHGCKLILLTIYDFKNIFYFISLSYSVWSKMPYSPFDDLQ